MVNRETLNKLKEIFGSGIQVGQAWTNTSILLYLDGRIHPTAPVFSSVEELKSWTNDYIENFKLWT